MKEVVVFLGVATLGCVVYHIGQKAVPAAANPMAILMGVYAVAFLAVAAAFPFFRAAYPGGGAAQVLNWPVLAVGLGVVLIEAGFLLAYRTGGSLQWSAVAVNGLAAVLLIPVAVFVFREKVSPARVAGILLTLSGLALIARQ